MNLPFNIYSKMFRNTNNILYYCPFVKNYLLLRVVEPYALMVIGMEATQTSTHNLVCRFCEEICMKFFSLCDVGNRIYDGEKVIE